MRGEKTRLAELAVKSEGLAAMNRLADEMAEVLQDLEARIGRTGQPGRKSRPGRKRSRSPKTGDDATRAYCGAEEARRQSRVADVLRKWAGSLREGCFQVILNGGNHQKSVWRNNAKWERNEMKKADFCPILHTVSGS